MSMTSGGIGLESGLQNVNKDFANFLWKKGTPLPTYKDCVLRYVEGDASKVDFATAAKLLLTADENTKSMLSDEGILKQIKDKGDVEIVQFMVLVIWKWK